jgi:alpha-1,3-rhamnosyl/mannosyltransferase
VYFAGETRDDETLRRLYTGAALYVQPSLSEGFGLPPLEAMACGTPVLSSDAGSLPEVLGAAAELLAPRGPEAWAAAVTALLGDTARRGVMAALGRRRAAGFTWERTARLTRETWRDALGGGAAGAGTRGDSRT